MDSRYIYFFGCLLSLIQWCDAQSGAMWSDRLIISAAELREDLDVLKNALQEDHPGLYHYQTEEEVDSFFGQLHLDLTDEMSALDFYRALAPLNSFIRDAHTKIFFPASLRKPLNTSWPRFPFALHWDDEKLIVVRNVSNDDEILAGWEIEKINGEYSAAVVDKIVRCIARDGYNASGPRRTINHDFSGWYAAVIGIPETFSLECKAGDGTKRTVVVKALTTPEIMAKRSYRKSSISPPVCSLEISDEVATLVVRSFVPDLFKESGQPYRKTFARYFNEIGDAEIKHLIIDIRDNQGGWQEVADELLSYLVPHNFDHCSYDRSITNKITSPHYLRNDGYFKHFKGLRFKEREDGYDVFWNDSPVKPKSKIYTGALTILINGWSASQSGEFSGLLREHTDAYFIGEETGGNPKLLCGGDILTFVLPHSGLRMHIPVRKRETAVGFNNSGYGIKPDLSVPETAVSRIAKEDIPMEKALKRIQNSYEN